MLIMHKYLHGISFCNFSGNRIGRLWTDGELELYHSPSFVFSYVKDYDGVYITDNLTNRIDTLTTLFSGLLC